MSLTLETRVDGSPSSIRTAAAWLLDSLAAGGETFDEEVYQQYRGVAPAWEGEGAEPLRGRLSTLANGGGTLSQVATTMARELEALATALELTLSDMSEAREQAGAGGLRVVGTVIHGPGDPPPDVPPLPAGASSAEAQAHGQALAAIAAWDRRCALWNTLVEIVDAGHQRWATAVDSAVGVWEGNKGNLVGLFSELLSGGVSASAMAVVAYNAKLLRGFHLDSAAAYARHVTAVTPGGRLTTTPQHFYDLVDSGAQHLDDAARAGRTAATPRVPAGVARGLLAVGVVATGYGIYDDIQNGESPAQAAVSNGGGFLASMGAGALIGAGVGSVLPVGGTIVGGIVGAVGGAVVGLVTSGMIDSMWENGVDSLGDVGSAIADGWDEMTETVGDAGEMIGDAAGAIGGGLKDAWNAIF